MTRIADARAQYWRDNGFGIDGGLSKTWDIVKVGPIPVPIRNVDGRKRALQFHDIHHLVTGYRTDLRGEGEIVAWEIAVGCGALWFAWFINFQGLLIGLRHPRLCLRAYTRGRHSRGLYKSPFDPAILDKSVVQLTTELGLNQPVPNSNLIDVLGWATWVAGSAAVHLVGVGVAIAIVWGLLT
jgi:hypothetical protein